MRNIFDYAHVKKVSAIALLKNGEFVGKIVCNWSDNPSGSVCTAQVMLWDKEFVPKIKKHKIDGFEGDFEVCMIGKAGGSGYDKRSAAIASALSVGGLRELLPVVGGSGNE